MRSTCENSDQRWSTLWIVGVGAVGLGREGAVFIAIRHCLCVMWHI
jgi:hypothetical protein